MLKSRSGAAACLAAVLVGVLLGRLEADWLIGLLLGGGVLWLCWENFRWLRRASWAGPVILAGAGAPLRRIRLKGWTLAAFGGIGSAVWYRADLSPLLAMASILTAGWFYAVGSPPEFREQGVVFAGRLFRWNDIGSHAWRKSGCFLEVSARAGCEAAWIRARLPARPESKGAIESLLRRRSANLLTRGADATGTGNHLEGGGLGAGGGSSAGGGWVDGGEGSATGLSGQSGAD